ncbi:MAG: purine-nucleoside phosphorylase [Candidatus Abyssobacteria bacterium SURF_5]|uniref:Purine nucleoside phosphorylase n=1 Tax=Abyssobacteria bacterium (strain SURF_5) TaxID=2093360 RepID=A0A3A4P8F2_ABYX5|nr:MAG: purine-nucleoside phosphorylase [Candidatus Abyssubacteria bacterium SURF_5]
MVDLVQKIQETTASIRKRTDIKPEIGIILGTGLGSLVKTIKGKKALPYDELPNFPVSTVMSHENQMVFGRIGEHPVAAMQGRFHYYEGYTMQEVTFPVRVMKALGIKTLVVSNAAGGMNPQFKSGDLMVISDHINLMNDNPLRGRNDDRLGPRFPDMCEPYDSGLIDLLEKVALDEKIPLKRGVYVAVPGPNLETRAEYRFLRSIGADAVGMSTVPEVIVAVHAGLKVLGISVITDECFPDALKPANIDIILKVAAEAEPKLGRLISKTITSMK